MNLLSGINLSSNGKRKPISWTLKKIETINLYVSNTEKLNVSLVFILNTRKTSAAKETEKLKKIELSFSIFL